MKLISCDGCGVVLDADKLWFPRELYKEDGTIDATKAEWGGNEWVAKVQCPVCQGTILESD